MSTRVELSNRAVKDLRGLHPSDRDLVVTGLRALATGEANLDVKVLRGRPPWLRMRCGEYRILYRPVDSAALRVQRIVHRRDLERAVKLL